MNAAQIMNVGTILRQTARLFPNHKGLIQGNKYWTWQEIDQRVDAMVTALRDLGLSKGDKILVHSRNNLQYFESCWVAFRLGCVWVPTNFRLTPPEVAYLAESSGSKAILYEAEFSEHVDAVRQASPAAKHVICIDSPRAGEHAYENLVKRHLGSQPEFEIVGCDDPLWFFYTSGTTGKPKAGILTHGQLTFVVTNQLADVTPGMDENDCSIAVAPLSHAAGVQAFLNISRGAPTVLPEDKKLNPEEIWQLVEKYRVTNFFAVPTIVKMLVEHPSVDHYDHSSLKYVVYAGAPMYRSDQKLALQKLGKVLVQYFGLGEVTTAITVQTPHMHSADDNDPNANIGSCGKPRVGMEVAILDNNLKELPVGDVGEICCRGPAVFVGYHNNPAASEKALRGGWFHTGDLGRVDERGMLYITGRDSDMYISGGSNVYPREVEEVLLMHPSVAEVAVVGIPDPKWGEIGIAVIVSKDAAHSIAESELLKLLEASCARYRWPKRFIFWDALPKSGYGKITKKDVKRLLVERGDIVLESTS